VQRRGALLPVHPLYRAPPPFHHSFAAARQLATVTALCRLEKGCARVVSTAKAAILELALRRVERGGRDIPIELLSWNYFNRSSSLQAR
jgi:hypothetical protein